MNDAETQYDLSYRPDSYWEHSDPLQAILAGISGRARREMITDYWNAGKVEQLESVLLVDELPVENREMLGRISPFFMGGEYLPSRLPGEVPIVTIHLESTTFDVIELRARSLPGGKIGLRWVDEYDCAFDPQTKVVDQPLSFGELIALMEETTFDTVGTLPHVYNLMNIGYYADRPDEAESLRSFTTFMSDFYPELGNWSGSEISAWLDEWIKWAKVELEGVDAVVEEG